MIQDLRFEHDDNVMDIEIHPNGVYIEMYDGEGMYMGMPMNLEDIAKLRDHLTKIIDRSRSI